MFDLAMYSSLSYVISLRNGIFTTKERSKKTDVGHELIEMVYRSVPFVD
jgi:hypothetical protein